MQIIACSTTKHGDGVFIGTAIGFEANHPTASVAFAIYNPRTC